MLHCPCDAVTSQVQAREEGDLQQQALFNIFVTMKYKIKNAMAHISHVSQVSHSPRAPGPPQHQLWLHLTTRAATHVTQKIFPRVMAFILVSSLNYDPTYAVL